MEALHHSHKKGKAIILIALLVAAVIFLAGVNIGAKKAAQGGGTSLTGYAIASMKGSPSMTIPVQIEAAVDILEVPIHSDLEISTTSIVIETDDSTIEIHNENQVSLKDFKGTMFWNKSRLTIDGKAKQYFGQNTNIDWAKVKKIKLDVLEGSVDVKEFDHKELAMLPVGEVIIEENLLQVDNDELVLNDFTGRFDVTLTEEEVKLAMYGQADQVRVNGELSIVIK